MLSAVAQIRSAARRRRERLLASFADELLSASATRSSQLSALGSYVLRWAVDHGSLADPEQAVALLTNPAFLASRLDELDDGAVITARELARAATVRDPRLRRLVTVWERLWADVGPHLERYDGRWPPSETLLQCLLERAEEPVLDDASRSLCGFLPARARLVRAAPSGPVRVAAAAVTLAVRAHDDGIVHVSLCSESRLVTVGHDGCVRVWSSLDLRFLASFGPWSSTQPFVAHVFDDLSKVILGTVAGEVACVRLVPGRLAWSRRVGQGIVRAIVSTSDRANIAVGTDDGTVLVLARSDGSIVQRWQLDAGVRALASDAGSLVVGTADGRISVVDVASGSVRGMPAHSGAVTAVTTCRRQNVIVSGDADGHVVVARRDTLDVARKVRVGTVPVRALAMDVEGEACFVGDQAGALHRVDLRRPNGIDTAREHDDFIRGVVADAHPLPIRARG
jgi:hypothetical protein